MQQRSAKALPRLATVIWGFRASAGPEQASGSGPAEQSGRVSEARCRRLQAAGATG